MTKPIIIGANRRPGMTPGGFSRQLPSWKPSRRGVSGIAKAARVFLQSRGIDQMPDAFSGRQRLS
jgi:hypothetical protein